MGWYKQGPTKKAKNRKGRIEQSAEERMKVYQEALKNWEELYVTERDQRRKLEDSVWDAGFSVTDDVLVIEGGSWEARKNIVTTLASVVEHLADVETEEEALPAVHAALKVIRDHEAKEAARLSKGDDE